MVIGVAALAPWVERTMSQSRIDRLAFEREHAENAFVDLSQRLAADEPLERLDPQGELGQGKRARFLPRPRARRRARFRSAVYSGP